LIWLFVIIGALILYIVLMASVVWLEHRRPAVMTAWLFVSMLVPYIGFLVYLLIGKDYTRKKLLARLETWDEDGNSKGLNEAGPSRDMTTVGRKAMRGAGMSSHQMKSVGHPAEIDLEWLMTQLEHLTPYPITSGNRIRVLKDGEQTYSTILAQLESAQHHIHLDYYTIRDDGIGRDFAKVLIGKASAGVKVRVVYDGLGSHALPYSYILQLQMAGVSIVPFLPLRTALLERRLNYRNHRKIIVVDNRVGFLGGINIGDEYIGGDKRLGYWRDTHLQLEGPAVTALQRLFVKDWTFACGEQMNIENYTTAPLLKTSISNSEDGRVLIVPSSPGRGQRYILEVFFRVMTAARSRIYLTTPYFIPDSGLMAALITAARSGMDVRLLIPGIADTQLVLLATLSNIQELLDAGVRVYRYEKGFIHAKVLIVDHSIASIGTANMDMRSFNSNFELNALMFDRPTIEQLEGHFMTDLDNSRELDGKEFATRPHMQKAKEALASMLSSLL